METHRSQKSQVQSCSSARRDSTDSSLKASPRTLLMCKCSSPLSRFKDSVPTCAIMRLSNDQTSLYAPLWHL